MREFTVGLTLVLLVALAGAAIAGGVAADTEAGMTVTGAIETPSETVTIQGNDYEIDEIAVIEQGEPIETHVTSSEGYSLVLYNTDEQSEIDRHHSADDSTVVYGDEGDEFDTNDLEPGTYMLSLELDYQGRQAVTPVVVQGHDIDLDYPTSAEQDSEIDLEASVEPKSGLDQPESIEVAIWDGSGVTDVTLTRDGGTNYETTLSLASFDPGSYNVYATVIGDETVQNYPTSLAMEAGPSLTVTDGDDDQNGDEGTDDTSSDGDDENGTDDTSSDDDPDGDDGTNGASDDDQQNVLEPNETDETDADDSADDDQLGMAPLLTGVVALAVAVVVIGVRKRF